MVWCFRAIDYHIYVHHVNPREQINDPRFTNSYDAASMLNICLSIYRYTNKYKSLSVPIYYYVYVVYISTCAMPRVE